MILRPHLFVAGTVTFLFLLRFLDYFRFFQITRISASEETAERPVNFLNQSEIAVEAISAIEPYSIQALTSNSTLGFGGVLAVNLRARSDRRDLLTLASAYTDVDIEWIDAVRGEEISQKAIPLRWDTSKHTPGVLGSWRSHLNALERVIHEKWETALIIEDDVDWDVNIKSQMQLLANRTRSLGNTRREPSMWITDEMPTTNPYGNEWDLLWLGACANPPGDADSQLFPGENGSQEHWVWYARGGMCCNWAYAVTRASAIALSAWLQDGTEAADIDMSEWCGVNKCVAVWPTLFSAYRPPGGKRRGSDNDPNREEELEVTEKGYTPGLVNSTIVHILDKLGRNGR